MKALSTIVFSTFLACLLMEQIGHVEEQVSITADKNEIPKSDSEDCLDSSSAIDDFWYLNRNGLAKLEQGNERFKIIHKVRAWEKTQMLQPSLMSHGLAPMGEVDWKLSTLSLVIYLPNVEGMLMPSTLGTRDLETKSVETYPMDSVDALRGTVMRMIFQQRAGRAINLDMIKAGIDLFVEVDDKGKRYYYRNFEQVLLSHIDVRYAKLANEWLLTCSFHEYLKKALNCMKRREWETTYLETQGANMVEATRYELMDKRIRTVIELLFCDGRRAF